MKVHLEALGLDVWQSVVNGYDAPDCPHTDEAGIRAFENNAKAMHEIVRGLSDSGLVRVILCVSAKEMWDKLENIYVGDDEVKEIKLARQRKQFYKVKMKDDEKIAAFLNRVYEIVNTMRFLGGTIEDNEIVQNVLNSLPSRFRSTVWAIEARKDFDKLKVAELYGILVAREI